MFPDREGFLYPSVNADFCIECNECVRVCPFIIPRDPVPPIATFIAEHKDAIIVQQSSSGGVAYQLACHAFQNSGWFFGAAFDVSWKLMHDGISSLADLEKYRRSKYIQSEIGFSFRKVKELVNEGQFIVFIGTPCQIAGLASFLGNKRNTVVLVEVICHGVASPLIFTRYLAALSDKYKSIVEGVNFRDKEKAAVAMGITFKKGEKYLRAANNDLFFRAFGRGLSLRKSCGDCLANNFRSSADLEIGDFWGAKRKFKEFDENKGASLVIVRSKKGKAVWDSISSAFRINVADLEYACENNPNIKDSTMLSKERGQFFLEIDQTRDILRVLRKYTKRNYFMALYSYIVRKLFR
jgi:coenzyme F420-reducing hydrogenase beta subunit